MSTKRVTLVADNSVDNAVTTDDTLEATFTRTAYPLSVVGTPVNCTVTPSSITATDNVFTADFSSSTVGSNFSFVLKNTAPQLPQSDFVGASSLWSPFNTPGGEFTQWIRSFNTVTKNTQVDGWPVPFYSQRFSPPFVDGNYNTPASVTATANISGNVSTGSTYLNVRTSVTYNPTFATYANRWITQLHRSATFTLNQGEYITVEYTNTAPATGHWRVYLLDTVNGTWISIPVDSGTHSSASNGVATSSTYRIVILAGTYHPAGDTQEIEGGAIRRFIGYSTTGTPAAQLTVSGTVSESPGALIEAVQVQEIDDSLIHLYEITFPAPYNETVYLHNGLDFADGTGKNIYFPTVDGTTLNEYIAFPITVSGIEINSGGGSTKPSLIMANLPVLGRSLVNNQDGTDDEETLEDIISAAGIDSAEDFLYATVTCRTTLLKYTNKVGDSPSLPVEYPKNVYTIDRIAAESSATIEFELTTPADLDDVILPNRKVVGKYCSWEYQGALFGRGGCTYPKNSSNKWFDEYDQLLAVNMTTTTIGTWASSTNYSAGDRVKRSTSEYGWRIYEAVSANVGKIPEEYPRTWKRIDVCGKRLSSCKLRFQGIWADLSSDQGTLLGTVPGDEYLNTSVALPFGGFPGSKKGR